MRLDKFLTEMGKGSRTQVKDLIKKKRITVNGVIAFKPEVHINPEQDRIEVDHVPVVYESFEYYIMNKPAGVLTATEDKKQKTVLDLLNCPHRNDLFPVGRLDKDTEGLLLITNDGDLCHNLLSPKKHVDKTYYAKVEGEITKDLIPIFAEGFSLLDGVEVRPSLLEIIVPFDGTCTEVQLTIHEGKFHQVKRMFERFGGKVVYLKRISFGPLVLEEEALPIGTFRKLTIEERDRLYHVNKNS